MSPCSTNLTEEEIERVVKSVSRQIRFTVIYKAYYGK